MELLRERTDRLGEVCELRDKEGELSLVSIEEFSSRSDEVTEIDEFLRELVGGDWLCLSCEFCFSLTICDDRAVLPRKKNLYTI